MARATDLALWAALASVVWVAAMVWSVRLCQESGSVLGLVVLVDAVLLGVVVDRWKEARAAARWADLERWYEAQCLDAEVRRTQDQKGI